MTTTLHPSPDTSPTPGTQENTPIVYRPEDTRRTFVVRLPAALRHSDRPRWEIPAYFSLLGATLIAWCINLTASGWANSFYTAAVQAGATNWEAFLFGSSDAGNSITVDKPPAFLWIMALSVRIFGLNTVAILLPQVLMGVATIAILYGAIRQVFSARAALIAGVVLATTPVATLMFRFNNPDALLMLLLTTAAYCVVRAIKDDRARSMIWAGVCFGFGFLTKQLQALVVLPGFGLVFLFAAAMPWRRRLRNTAFGVGAMLVSAGWWVALVELLPASMRPYVGGSQHNSFLELTFGYNGLGRITGNETGSVGGGGGTSAWGETGIFRMFSDDFGGQISWLLPTALIVFIAVLILRGRAPRTDEQRASILLWGSWVVVTGLVFSFMSGIIHAYYSVALAPGIAATVGIGAALLWEAETRWAKPILSLALAIGTLWAWVLLLRSSDVALAWAALLFGLAGAATIGLVSAANRRQRGLLGFGAILASTGLLVGPLYYSGVTIAQGHSGSIVTAGPQTTTSGGPGGGRGGGPAGGQGGPGSASNGTHTPQGTQGNAPGSQQQPGAGGQAPTTGQPGGNQSDGRAGGNAMGGLLNGSTASTALTKLLKTNASTFTWVAATTGSQNAASYQLASGHTVMPIGGFNGTDPSPTLAQFKRYVADGKIHNYIAGSSFGSGQNGTGTASSIATWVSEHFTAQTVGGTTVYDLTAAK